MAFDSRKRTRASLQRNVRIGSWSHQKNSINRKRAERKATIRRARICENIITNGAFTKKKKKNNNHKGSCEAHPEKIILDQQIIIDLKNRPKKRADCSSEIRPCPWIGCKHHMFWCFTDRATPRPQSSIQALLEKMTDEQIIEKIISLKETCVLDVIDKLGRATLQDIADLLGITRERVRQIESGRGKNGRGCTIGALIKIQKTKNKLRMLEDFND